MDKNCEATCSDAMMKGKAVYFPCDVVYCTTDTMLYNCLSVLVDGSSIGCNVPM